MTKARVSLFSYLDEHDNCAGLARLRDNPWLGSSLRLFFEVGASIQVEK